MKAAIYARKSTEQNVSDEEKAVTRQVEHAKAYAAKQGWTVDDAHVFVDDGISGAEFIKRPGFIRLMSALKPCPAFQVLVMMEQSRLGREQTETGVALRRLADAGVRVFTYLTGTEIKRETAMDKFIAGSMAFVDEMAREQARQRTRDALARKAARGFVTGGTTFGYENVRMDDHVIRRILPAEAEVVRRIFRLVASGLGLSKVAKRLNAEGVRAPGGRSRGWSPSGVRHVLFRETYVGKLVYGRLVNEYRGSTARRRAATTPDELIVHHDQTLRIVDDALWHAAHDRLAQARDDYARTTGEKIPGRHDGQFLLSGLVECASCHGPMHAVARPGRRGIIYRYYICARFRTSRRCENALAVPIGRLHDSVIEALRRDVLSPEVVMAVVARAIAMHEESRRDTADHRTDLEAELTRLGLELGRYAEAIATAGPCRRFSVPSR